jgi:putative membrane protein
MMGYDWGNSNAGWNGFGMFGGLSMLLFWALLVLGVIALVRSLSKSESSKDDKIPLDILKERYARGEIDKKEFDEKKKDIG